MADVEELWTPEDGTAVRWLAELDPEHNYAGYEPPGLPDSVWVLHAMYVWRDGLVTTTHDDLHRSLLTAGLRDRDGGADLAEGGTVTGGALGRTGRPGPGWRRLRWAELARGTGEPPVPEDRYPSYRCLRRAHPTGSWSAAVEPPGEGALDREGWYRLMEILARHGADGARTECLAYYCPLVTNEWDAETVLSGILLDAPALYDHPAMPSCPSNLWAVDRSWAVYCDWDLWGTKVVGPTALVEAILADDELEALRLPWTT